MQGDFHHTGNKPLFCITQHVRAVSQVFVGRVAMIGFAAAIVGEIQTGGKGPLGQLALPIQTPVNPGLAGECLCTWFAFVMQCTCI